MSPTKVWFMVAAAHELRQHGPASADGKPTHVEHIAIGLEDAAIELADNHGWTDDDVPGLAATRAQVAADPLYHRAPTAGG